MSSDIVIQVENLSKQYRLGQVSTGTISHDLNRWWHRIRGKEDPYLKVTQTNIRDQKKATAEQADQRGSKPLVKHLRKSAPSAVQTDSDYVWALKDINFEVKQGEVLGIIGRNGAGKSTLLKILSRVTAPTTGEVRTKGRIGSLLEVGTGFHLELTGRENIFLNGAILGMTKREVTSKLDEIVDFSGCERYLDTPVKRYSSGMMVRLGFAVAAHLEPEILIIDEVLAVGDAEFQKKCIGKMQDVAGHGKTVLFVSHNMASIEALCSSVMVVDKGRISARGDAEAGIHAYLSKSAQTSSTADLSQATRRKGSEQKLLQAAAIRDTEGRTSNTIAFGSSFSLEASCAFPTAVSGARVWFIIKNWMDQRVISLQSDYQSRDTLKVEGEAHVTCRVPWCCLLPGAYTVTVAIGDGARFLDIVDNAMSVEVVAADAFGTGRIPKPSHAQVAIQAEWSVTTP